jgi:hypothetical protein
METTEPDFDMVIKCQEFMRKHQDPSLRSIVSPFSGRSIKKNGPTYNQVYLSVKKYLQNLDEEEFHSPIKTLQVIKYEVPPLLKNNSPERNLVDTQNENGIVLTDWHKKIEKKLEAFKEKKNVIIDINERYINFRYDEPIMNTFMPDGSDFEIKKVSWMDRNIELYSLLFHYKPEIFENRYIFKHLIAFNFSSIDQFINWLPANCELFVMKRYDIPNNTGPSLNAYQRYIVAIINLWIYQPFIIEMRKFLKKNKNKVKDYINSKPSHLIKLKKQHFTSLILAYTLMKTKIQDLSEIKKNYESYFVKMMSDFFKFSDEERIYNRAQFAMILTDFLGNRIRPYRFTSMKFDDLENFDIIVKNLDNPPVKIAEIDLVVEN